MAYPQTMSQRDMQAKAMKGAYNKSMDAGTLGRGFGGPTKAKGPEIRKQALNKAISTLKNK